MSSKAKKARLKPIWIQNPTSTYSVLCSNPKYDDILDIYLEEFKKCPDIIFAIDNWRILYEHRCTTFEEFVNAIYDKGWYPASIWKYFDSLGT